jgi:hypothetical protein
MYTKTQLIRVITGQKKKKPAQIQNTNHLQSKHKNYTVTTNNNKPKGTTKHKAKENSQNAKILL